MHVIDIEGRLGYNWARVKSRDSAIGATPSLDPAISHGRLRNHLDGLPGLPCRAARIRAGWVERIVSYSPERYVDTVTGRLIVVGRIDDVLVMIPYERESRTVTPVTVHATTRQQINLRLKTGRFANE